MAKPIDLRSKSKKKEKKRKRKKKQKKVARGTDGEGSLGEHESKGNGLAGYYSG